MGQTSLSQLVAAACSSGLSESRFWPQSLPKLRMSESKPPLPHTPSSSACWQPDVSVTQLSVSTTPTAPTVATHRRATSLRLRRSLAWTDRDGISPICDSKQHNSRDQGTGLLRELARTFNAEHRTVCTKSMQWRHLTRLYVWRETQDAERLGSPKCSLSTMTRGLTRGS